MYKLKHKSKRGAKRETCCKWKNGGRQGPNALQRPNASPLRKTASSTETIQMYKLKHKSKRGAKRETCCKWKNALQKTKTNAASSNALQIEKRCRALNDSNQETFFKSKTLHSRSLLQTCRGRSGCRETEQLTEQLTERCFSGNGNVIFIWLYLYVMFISLYNAHYVTFFFLIVVYIRLYKAAHLHVD